MDILDTLKRVDSIEGAYVEIGYGKGKSANVILSLMKEGKVKKRTSYLVDSFKTFPIGPAMDKRHFLPGYDIKVVKALLKDSIPNALKEVNIAVLQVDLGSKEANKKAITTLSPLLVRNGIVIPVQYKEDKVVEKVNDIVKVKEVAFGVRYTKDREVYLQSSGRFDKIKEVNNSNKKIRTEVPDVRYKRK